MKHPQTPLNSSTPLLLLEDKAKPSYAYSLPSMEIASKWLWYNNVVPVLLATTFNYMTDDWIESLAPGYALLFINGVPFAIGMIKATILHNCSYAVTSSSSGTSESKSKTLGYLVKAGMMHTLNSTGVITKNKTLAVINGGTNVIISLAAGELAQKYSQGLWSRANEVKQKESSDKGLESTSLNLA